MVTRIRHDVLDDLTGESNATTRTYSIDGQHYEIDLVDANWVELQECMAKFTAVSRRRGVKRAAAAERSTKGASAENARIREWARASGIEVPERGRIPQKIREAYAAAN